MKETDHLLGSYLMLQVDIDAEDVESNMTTEPTTIWPDEIMATIAIALLLMLPGPAYAITQFYFDVPDDFELVNGTVFRASLITARSWASINPAVSLAIAKYGKGIHPRNMISTNMRPFCCGA